MKKYICAMTLGPIVDTIANADEAVKLWKGSFMFSMLSKNICDAVSSIEENTNLAKYKCKDDIFHKGEDKDKKSKQGINIELLTPCFESNSAYDRCIRCVEELNNMGVGVYHDHIIFTAEVYDFDTSENDFKNDLNKALADCIKEAKEKTIISFNAIDENGYDSTFNCSKEEMIDFFDEYMYVRGYIEERNKDKDEDKYDMNEISKPLNSLEIENKTIYRHVASKNFFYYDNILLKKLMTANSTGQDKTLLNLNSEEMVLVDKERSTEINIKIKGIDQIGETNAKIPQEDKEVKENKIYKFGQYFAFVNADGDNMGKFLSEFSRAEDIKKYSEICGLYAHKAVKEVQKYGGVVFYAGGDDLIFLAPLKGKDGSNILKLINGIGKIFKKTFTNELKCYSKYSENANNLKNPINFEKKFIDNNCSLSFGVSINYRKYPLYDAYAGADNLIKDAKYKSYIDDYKNKCVLELTKHSGKTAKFTICKISDDFEDSLMEVIETLINDSYYRNDDQRNIGENGELIDNKDKMDRGAIDRNFGSVLSHLATYRSLYIHAFKNLNTMELHHINSNLLDDVNKDIVKKLNMIAEIIIDRARVSKLEKKKLSEKIYNEYVSIIRYCKLFIEEGEYNESEK